MPINNFPNMRTKTYGRDFNFYQKATVTSTVFLGATQPDMMITFPTQTVLFFNEAATSSTTSVVEYSFNGNTVHGELDSSLPSRSLTFNNRTVSAIWFRIKQGSSGPVTIRVDAWGIP